MQGLSITTQHARLEIRTQRAQLNIETPKPRMRIRTRKAAMRIERRAPQFRVSKAKGMEPGLRSPLRLAQDIKNDNIRSQLNTNTDQNGTEKASGLDLIADIAQERARSSRNAAKSSLASMPTLEWDMGYYDVNWDMHELVIDWETTGQGIKISMNPHSVEIKLSRYPLVRITYNAEYFDLRNKKRKLDTKI